VVEQDDSGGVDVGRERMSFVCDTEVQGAMVIFTEWELGSGIGNIKHDFYSTAAVLDDSWL